MLTTIKHFSALGVSRSPTHESVLLGRGFCMPQTPGHLVETSVCSKRRVLGAQRTQLMLEGRLGSPSTSYRIGKPTKCKNTPQHTKCEIPQIPLGMPTIRKSYFGGIFLAFSGYFFDLLLEKSNGGVFGRGVFQITDLSSNPTSQ